MVGSGLRCLGDGGDAGCVGDTACCVGVWMKRKTITDTVGAGEWCVCVVLKVESQSFIGGWICEDEEKATGEGSCGRGPRPPWRLLLCSARTNHFLLFCLSKLA